MVGISRSLYPLALEKIAALEQRVKELEAEARVKDESLKILSEQVLSMKDVDSQNTTLRADNERLRNALRLAADEPNIDRARAIADKALGGGHEHFAGRT
jgi:hypothetical protein